MSCLPLVCGRYREKARRLRLSSRNDASADDNPLASFEVTDSVKDSEHSMPPKPTDSNHLTTTSTYNLRRKIHSSVPGHSERSTVLPTVPEQTADSQRLHFDEVTLDRSLTNFWFVMPCQSVAFCLNLLKDFALFCSWIQERFHLVSSRTWVISSKRTKKKCTGNRYAEFRVTWIWGTMDILDLGWFVPGSEIKHLGWHTQWGV